VNQPALQRKGSMHSVEYVGKREFDLCIRGLQFERHLLRPQRGRTTRDAQNDRRNKETYSTSKAHGVTAYPAMQNMMTFNFILSFRAEPRNLLFRSHPPNTRLLDYARNDRDTAVCKAPWAKSSRQHHARRRRQPNDKVSSMPMRSKGSSPV
jgi:hypothetical protein